MLEGENPVKKVTMAKLALRGALMMIALVWATAVQAQDDGYLGMEGFVNLTFSDDRLTSDPVVHLHEDGSVTTLAIDQIYVDDQGFIRDGMVDIGVWSRSGELIDMITVSNLKGRIKYRIHAEYRGLNFDDENARTRMDYRCRFKFRGIVRGRGERTIVVVKGGTPNRVAWQLPVVMPLDDVTSGVLSSNLLVDAKVNVRSKAKGIRRKANYAFFTEKGANPTSRTVVQEAFEGRSSRRAGKYFGRGRLDSTVGLAIPRDIALTRTIVRYTRFDGQLAKYHAWAKADRLRFRSRGLHTLAGGDPDDLQLNYEQRDLIVSSPAGFLRLKNEFVRSDQARMEEFAGAWFFDYDVEVFRPGVGEASYNPGTSFTLSLSLDAERNGIIQRGGTEVGSWSVRGNKLRMYANLNLDDPAVKVSGTADDATGEGVPSYSLADIYWNMSARVVSGQSLIRGKIKGLDESTTEAIPESVIDSIPYGHLLRWSGDGKFRMGRR